MEENRFSRVDLYILGHKEIDDEHKAIYDSLEAMWRTVPPDAIPELMENARIACRHHFEHERQLMEMHEYPFIESHMEIHEATIKKFFDTIDHPTTKNLQHLVDDFLDHIELYDRLFVDWIKGDLHRRSGDHQTNQLRQKCA